jgi:hypothetical protein
MGALPKPNAHSLFATLGSAQTVAPAPAIQFRSMSITRILRQLTLLNPANSSAFNSVSIFIHVRFVAEIGQNPLGRLKIKFVLGSNKTGLLFSYP